MNETTTDRGSRNESTLPTSADGLDHILRRLAGTPSETTTGPIAPEAALSRAVPRIDGYEILAELGHGGMGTVYRARQLSTSRMVAIKVIAGRLGAHTEAVRRFEREVRILGRLEHHRIANVFAAGRTRDGEPYFAMELVEGVRLDQHLETSGPLDPKLDLFRKICDAVGHAHRFGVIHRDLKPGNILVCDDGSEVKVLDFGLARLTEPDSDIGASLTREGSVQGTLAYMSPEQIAGASITVASDIYSLGVILYELIAGRRPYEVSPQDLREAIRVICDQVPRPPCRSMARSERPRRAADLDAIALRALEKDPARRYPSVAGLLTDLDNYLQSRPVESRNFGSRALRGVYRLGLLCRRHRAATLIGAVTCLGLVALGLRQNERQISQQNAERGRQELLAGQPLRAAAHFAEAYLHGGSSPTLMLQLGLATRALTPPAYTLTESLHGPASANVSRDGQRWLSVGPEGKALLRDIATGRLLATLDSGCPNLRFAEMSPDETRFLTVCNDQTISLWAADFAKLRTLLPAPSRDYRHKPVFSPDGRRLGWSTGGGRRGWSTEVWDADAGQRLATVPGDLRAFAPDGASVLTSTEEKLLLSETDTGNLLWSVNESYIRTATFNADGTRFVALGPEGAQLRDAADGRSLATLGSNGSEAIAARFSQDGEILATAGFLGPVKVWDGRDGHLVTAFQSRHSAGTSLDLSPDGTLLAVAADQGVRVFDTASGQLVHAFWFLGNPDFVSFALGGHAIVTSHRGLSRLWTLQHESGPIGLAQTVEDLSALAFSPDGKHLMTVQRNGTLGFWNPKDGRALRLAPGTGQVPEMLFRTSNKGRLTLQEQLVAVQTWVSQNHELLASMGWNPQELADQSMKRQRFVSGFNDWQAYGLMPKVNGNIVEKIDALNRSPRHGRGAALSLDTRRMAWMGPQDVVSIRDTEKVSIIASFRSEAENLNAAAYSPDAVVLAIGTSRGTVELWEADAGRLLATLEAHPHPVVSVAFSPDGKSLATAGKDGAVRIWDLAPESRVPAVIEQLLRCQVAWVLGEDELVPMAPDPSSCKEEAPGESIDL